MVVLLTVEDNQTIEYSTKALSLIKEDNTLDALFFLDKVIDRNRTPDIMSGYGMCIAMERGKVKEGIDLCLNAIEADPGNVFHYLNLGKVYLKDNKKAVALDIFRKGLNISPESDHHMEIEMILDKLGTRKRPVLSFLPRKNPANKFIGIILGKLGLR